jgi:hypothetical protein
VIAHAHGSCRPWAAKAGDMFKEDMLGMIFVLFNTLRDKLDMNSTHAGLRTRAHSSLALSLSLSCLL